MREMGIRGEGWRMRRGLGIAWILSALAWLLPVGPAVALPPADRGGAERRSKWASDPRSGDPTKGAAAFDAVQKKLPQVLRTEAGRVHIFATGISLPREDLALLGEGVFGLEQRHLGLAMRVLRESPVSRAVWVGSTPLPPGMIELYGERFFGGGWPDVRRRFTALGVDDHEPTRWLPEKILGDAGLLARLQREVRQSGKPAQLHVYRMTEAEAALAVALDAPAVAQAPKLQHLGTKSGSRQLARDAVERDASLGPHLLPGREGLRTRRQVADAIFALNREHGVPVAMIKANEGSSGEGQVGVALPPMLLDALSRLSESDGRALVRRWLRKGFAGTSLSFRHPAMSWPSLMGMIEAMGGVVEAFIPEVLEAQAEGRAVSQASVQFLADGLNRPRIIGSADVIAHGGQELLAGPSEHPELEGMHAFAEALLAAAAPSLLGRGSFDFTGGDRPVFTETNVRETAVTAPVEGVAKPLANAQYDRATGRLLDTDGRSWHWVAAGSVALPGGGGRAGRDDAWADSDPWWRPAFEPGRFRDGAFVLPTQMYRPGYVGLVAGAPGSRAAALEAFDTALERLGEL